MSCRPRVVATDVLDDDGAALAAELGDVVIYRHLDVVDAAAWPAVVAESLWGPISVLVNNAGIVTFGAVVGQVKPVAPQR